MRGFKLDGHSEPNSEGATAVSPETIDGFLGRFCKDRAADSEGVRQQWVFTILLKSWSRRRQLIRVELRVQG